MPGQVLAGARVALVLHSFDRGGSGRVAAYLAHGFRRHGLAVELFVFAASGAVEDAALEIIGPGVPIRHVRSRPGWRPLDLARGLPALVRTFGRNPPDMVVAAANNVAMVTAAALRLAGTADPLFFIKTTNPVAGSRHREPVRSARLAGYRAAFARADGVWTLSAEETAEMVRAFGARDGLLRDVANPYVTPEMLAPAPPPGPRRPRLVVSIARFTRQKRLERLLRAFAERPMPEARLLMLGDGEERPRLRTLAVELGVADRVDMPGHVEGVAATLHAADLMVLTSDYEGLPAAVLEALAANCPVLSTPCFPAARALLAGAPGCGIIDDVAPAALGAQIARHLRGERPDGLRRVAERYSIENGVLSHLDAMVAGQERRRRRAGEQVR